MLDTLYFGLILKRMIPKSCPKSRLHLLFNSSTLVVSGNEFTDDTYLEIAQAKGIAPLISDIPDSSTGRIQIPHMNMVYAMRMSRQVGCGVAFVSLDSLMKAANLNMFHLCRFIAANSGGLLMVLMLDCVNHTIWIMPTL